MLNRYIKRRKLNQKQHLIKSSSWMHWEFCTDLLVLLNIVNWQNFCTVLWLYKLYLWYAEYFAQTSEMPSNAYKFAMNECVQFSLKISHLMCKIFSNMQNQRNPAIQTILQTLQQFLKQVGCCGADGGDDFFSVHKPIPVQVENHVF